MICPHCHAPMRPGRHAIHDQRICRQSWYARVRDKHPRAPERPVVDLSPELIERIMARRALVQRWERTMGQG